MAWWLSWLERRPVTAEAVGSSPIWVVSGTERSVPDFTILVCSVYEQHALVAELADAWDLKSHVE